MEKLYSCKEISERLGVKISTVWCWIRDRRLPAVRIGKFYRVKASELEAFADMHQPVSDEAALDNTEEDLHGES